MEERLVIPAGGALQGGGDRDVFKQPVVGSEHGPVEQGACRTPVAIYERMIIGAMAGILMVCPSIDFPFFLKMGDGGRKSSQFLKLDKMGVPWEFAPGIHHPIPHVFPMCAHPSPPVPDPTRPASLTRRLTRRRGGRGGRSHERTG